MVIKDLYFKNNQKNRIQKTIIFECNVIIMYLILVKTEIQALQIKFIILFFIRTLQ